MPLPFGLYPTHSLKGGEHMTENQGEVWPLRFILKSILKQKEELWKLKYLFHHAKIYQSSKDPLKETKILQDIVTL
jgi:hypothetical protein